MSQETLGSILGIQKTAVEDIESGRQSDLSADKVLYLCESFHEYPAILLYEHNLNYWDHLLALKVGTKGLTIMNDVKLLNDMGIKRAKALIEDLLRIKEYQKEYGSPSVPDFKTGN